VSLRHYFAIFAIALVVTFVVTPLVRRFAIRRRSSTDAARRSRRSTGSVSNRSNRIP